MSLKRIIKEKMILSRIAGRPLTIPGEPMIYSLKYPVGQRTRALQFFRNSAWKSLLKAQFRSFYNTNTPVVLILLFFVSPPAGVVVSKKTLLKESLPAVKAYELLDYTLSFMEMLMHVLINSYKQIVKIDAEKFYSANPRTEVKFMKWEEYGELQNSDTDNTETKSLSKNGERKALQSKRKGNGTNNKLRTKEVLGKAHASTEGTAACDSALCSPCTSKPTRKKTPTAAFTPAQKEARRGQHGEVP